MIDLRSAKRMGRWQWAVSLLLLAATMINYMDRQTLANLAPRITAQFQLTQEQYGNLEQVFALSFAFGSLLWGVLADIVPIRILYPIVLIAWSAVGFVTGLTNGYESLFYCRGALGFFESGHWPCALVVTHAILSSSDRPLANSILQSGASLGAVVTPIIILAMVSGSDAPDAWRPPFLIIGSVGILWVIAWFAVVRRDSISQHQVGNQVPTDEANSTQPKPRLPGLIRLLISRKFWALVLMVVSINVAWQMIRAWLPKFLQEGRGYSETSSLSFMSAYYISTDVGCLLAGAAALALARRGWTAHRSRLFVYGVCAALSSLTVVAAMLPASVAFLVVLLVVGAGTLGLFPCYYSFTQEVDSARVGKITGILSFLGWILSAPVHPMFGAMVDRTKSYDAGVAVVGLVPLIGLLAMLILWPTNDDHPETSHS